MAGLFITFEGVDLCGKSTQAQLLVKYLREKKIEVVLSREPGGPPISEKIRQILLSREHAAMRPLTELLLYEAGRAQHTEELIKPSLEAGRCVILDRYADASTAYQGWGRQLGADLVKRINELATGGLSPDMTILLDLPPEEAARRAPEKDWQADRLEGEAIEFHRRVREGYRQLAAEEPDRIKLIDGRGSIDDIHSRILALIKPLLRERFPQFDIDGRSTC